AQVWIDDGTNVIVGIIGKTGGNSLSLAANQSVNFPQATSAAIAVAGGQPQSGPRYIVSGTMRLIIAVKTATVSLTHTFAVECRIKGAMPTATLADSVGTPVLTTNTNAVF